MCPAAGREHQNLGKSGKDGSFALIVPHLLPGGPEVLTIRTSSGAQYRACDVYIGEVFLCSGQSNMELPIERVKDRFPEELTRPACQQLRLYKVKEDYDFQGPKEDHKEAAWRAFSPEYIREFSALSYFFARFLHEDRKVPVGIINVSLGGSPVEAWMGEEALRDVPGMTEWIDRYRSQAWIDQKLSEDAKREAAWYREIEEKDAGWDNPGREWRKICLPGYLSEAGLEEFCGSIWLRRYFHVPSAMAGKAARLWLGTMVDSDTTYINGRKVGETGYQYPPRKYEIPGGCLKEGINEIRIRLLVCRGAGRMTRNKSHEIFCDTGRIDLDGVWEYKIGCRVGHAPDQDFVSWQPTGLYNAMLAPCHPYTIRGVLWYQGESNDKRPDTYEQLLQRMIVFWREKWNQESLPFLVAQLPDFLEDLPEGDESWPKIREAQRRAESLPEVAVTVNLELGEDNDLHPLNKKAVAYRMYLAASGMIYGEKVVWRWPHLMGIHWEKGELTLTFDTGDGRRLTTLDGGWPEEFEVAGRDGLFCPAKARVEGNNVILCAREAPEAVRYAWRDAPRRGLLCNRAGLSASPFEIKRGAEEEREGGIPWTVKR